MKLTLVRHGSTLWNAKGWVQGQADPPLNEEGISQAQQLAEILKPTLHEYEIIYCSPLQRAVKTAEIIQNHTSISLIPDKRLISRDLGTFSGHTLDDLKQSHSALYDLWIKGDKSFCPPGGESTQKMIIRTREFIQFLRTTHKSVDKILIVSHRENIGGIMKVVGFHFKGDPLKLVDNCKPYYIDLI